MEVLSRTAVIGNILMRSMTNKMNIQIPIRFITLELIRKPAFVIPRSEATRNLDGRDFWPKRFLAALGMTTERFSDRFLIAFFILFLLPPFAHSQSVSSFHHSTEFINGADVSFIPQVEDRGGVYTEDGISKDPLEIFSAHGVNYIRLKLWHSPRDGYNGIERVKALAKRIRKHGFRFLLDFHFSDTWADPGRQQKPRAWENATGEVLEDSLFAYTKDVITQLRYQNTLPDMVQIGNEIICGMVWPDGSVCDPTTEEKWARLAALLNRAMGGVREGAGVQQDSIRFMIHIDRGGNNADSRWFYDGIRRHGVEFDVIGLSFYPWWHGTLDDLEANLNDLARRYDKDLIVVETAYPWTLQWNDGTNNIIGSVSQLHQKYSATVAGQKQFLVDLIEIIRNVDDNKGIGVFYWAPEWISAPGSGSAWENLALFDFSGEVLESIAAFEMSTTAVKQNRIHMPLNFTVEQNYPNPFSPHGRGTFGNSATTITYNLPAPDHVKLVVYNTLGQKIAELIDEMKQAGIHQITFDSADANLQRETTGVYFYKLIVGNGKFVQTRKMTLLN